MTQEQHRIHPQVKGSVVLLVSDDPVARYMLPTQLDFRGVITIDTNSVDNALKLLHMHQDINIVLIDMPLIDSLEGVNAIREHQELDHIPVLVLGEYEMHDHKLAALSAGANDYVVKSLNVNSLVDSINEQLLTVQENSATDTLDDYEVLYQAGQIVLNKFQEQRLNK